MGRITEEPAIPYGYVPFFFFFLSFFIILPLFCQGLNLSSGQGTFVDCLHDDAGSVTVARYV